MHSRIKCSNFRYLFVVPCFIIFSSAFIVLRSSFIKDKQVSSDVPPVHQTTRTLLQSGNESVLECIPSGIHSFPEDFFTQEERQRGGVIIHFLILFYACAMIAIVCDIYFIPALEVISEKLNLPPDVAGATFMAIGASSPELFSSILGSFVTEGDIGVGAVIGSAVFNILGITGVAGIALWNEVLDIDWYPMVRDCIAYSITVLTLVWIIWDSIVTWWESVILLVIFFLYILLMYFNRKVEKFTRNLAKRIGPDFCSCCNCEQSEEKTPLLNEKVFVPELLQNKDKPHMTSAENTSRSTSTENTSVSISEDKVEDIREDGSNEDEVEEEERRSLCSPPTNGPWHFIWWLGMLPASAVISITIPDPTNPTCRKFFPLTFLMAIAWLGVLSYIAVWMVTIIGYTLSIPDAVSGLTILAVGASVPDLISSVIVAKSGKPAFHRPTNPDWRERELDLGVIKLDKPVTRRLLSSSLPSWILTSGQGNMAISNLVGSNNFDISICLGVPWLGKTLISENGYLKLYSSALSFATATLLVTLIIFFLIFQLSGWKLNRTVGLMCLVIYALFVILACLFEFNVFGDINLPTCYP